MSLKDKAFKIYSDFEQSPKGGMMGSDRMIYCNYCGKESEGGILYVDGYYMICNECKKRKESNERGL